MTLRRHAEVHQADGAALQEDVLQGYVAVPDAMLMQVSHRLQQLPHVAPRGRLRQLAMARHLVEEVAALRVLGQEPSAVAIKECAMHAQQVHGGVGLLGQVLQDADLRQRVLEARLPPAAKLQVRGTLVVLDIAPALGGCLVHLLARDVDVLLALPRPPAPEDVAMDAARDPLHHSELALGQLAKCSDLRVEVPQVRDERVAGDGIGARSHHLFETHGVGLAAVGGVAHL
mmetsp:Transcript_68169/g.197630  ORF Transcript_68169/g.197630 Transcript_68169/m.197630 type:complete len:230 (+) Transcript_68169:627-1316(+)